MKLRALAELLNGDIAGDPETEILRPAKIEEARPGDVTFLSNPKYARFLDATLASAVIVARTLDAPLRPGVSYLRVDDPYLGFLTALEALVPRPDPLPPGIHPTAVIAPTAQIGPGARLGAHVVIGEHASVGARSSICHNTVIGDGSSVGDDSLLYPNVTVREGCRIGSRVILHPGVVVGSDGFGFAPKPDGSYKKIPQLGGVVIEDDVEIGANTTIDRATVGETVIKRGAKLDNLIQIAHNVVVGEDTVIAAQTGIAGSTKVGAHCILAGQVGLVGHIEVADRTTIGAQSGVSKSLTAPGKVYFGSPVKERMRALRIEGAIRRLPELVTQLRQLQREIENLREALAARGPEPTNEKG